MMCGHEVKQASYHQLVWFERSTKSIIEKVKKTEKRQMKNFQLEKLKELCQKEDWKFRGGEERTKEMLEKECPLWKQRYVASLSVWPP